jgi:hypothetical protein
MFLYLLLFLIILGLFLRSLRRSRREKREGEAESPVSGRGEADRGKAGGRGQVE